MKIGIVGAGAIGCYLGGRLIAAGRDVVLIGRLHDEVRAHGLTLTDYRGERVTLSPERVAYHAEPSALADRELVLVTVKSMATEAAARGILPHLAPAATLVSFQNGVRNAGVLRAALPGHPVLAGMVPFNVLRQPEAHFHLGTSGPLALERGSFAAPLADALRQAGFAVELYDDLSGVLYTKLLFNLNNSLNALAGVPLRDQLRDRRWRLLLAGAMREGLACMKAAGIRPARFGTFVPQLAPPLLSLPDWLFFRVAGALIRIDPSARSSMWEDLERRRPTEIEHLNGEIVRLGERLGVPAPINCAVRERVLEAERSGAGSPRLSPAALY